MFKRTIAALVLAFATSAITPAHAGNVCDRAILPSQAVGKYTMTVGPGTYVAKGKLAPYAKVESYTAEIKKSGNQLILTSRNNFKVVMRTMVRAFDKDWKIKKGGKFGYKTSGQNLALAYGCEDINHFPRYKGKGTYIHNEGGTVQTGVSMIVYKTHDKGGISAFGGMIASTKKGVTFNLRFKLTPK